MRSRLVPGVLLFAVAAPLSSQSPVPLSGTWRFGSIAIETFGSACTPAAPASAVSEAGVATLQPGGTGTIMVAAAEVCPGGFCSQTNDSGQLNYAVGPDGVVTFADPLTPGADTAFAFLRADRSVFLLGRWNEFDDEPFFTVVVALSSGQSAGSLTGDYGFVRYVLRNDASGQTMRGDRGTLSFDGVAMFSEASDRHQVSWNGAATSKTTFTGSSSYAVANDGTVTIGPGGSGGTGAMSPDGEFVFWVNYACPQVEMVLAVRQPATVATTWVAGDWRIGSTEVDVVASTLDSDWGTIALTPTSPTAGTLDPGVFRVSTQVTPFSTNTGTVPVVADTYTIGGAGAVTLFANASQRLPVPGWVSSDGSLFVGAPALPSGAATSPGCGLTVGVARCSLPVPVGAGTPGSGGIAPQLFSLGGFPFPGNGAFGFLVATGLGGAPGLVLFAPGVLPAPLPVFGFDLWIGPSLDATALVVLSGPPGVPGVGAAGLPLALPPTPPLAGVALGVQAVVLDPAAPQGFSASGALGVLVGR